MRKISANWILPIHTRPIKNGTLICDDQGTIQDILTAENSPSDAEQFEGMLVPGFVNTHCHLELSHLKGIAPSGTGLISFITKVVQNRDHEASVILKAIEDYENHMIENGIVAVGDISNTSDTAFQKAKGNLYYHTFLEMFDMMDESQADQTFAQYDAAYKKFESHSKHKISAVPHAPYSVSPKLYEMINAKNKADDITVSIHNQESVAENEYVKHGTGDFKTLFTSFGVNLEGFKPIGKNAIHFALQHLDSSKKTLFVHNTQSSKEDIQAAIDWGQEVFWASCANANLYIENRLPDYQCFLDAGATMTIGTDSIMSNWTLSVLDEMKAILKYKAYLDFETVLQWATLNGARALGFEKQLGSFEVGKTPGLNLLSQDNPSSIQINLNTEVKRIM